MGNNRNGLKRSSVARAAEACFERYGVHRTSMVDVADALGVARQTLYRVFEGRTELLEYIASDRITKLGKKLESAFSRFQTLREALVEGSLLSLQSRHSDPLLEEIFAHSDDHCFEQFLFRGSPEVRASMLKIWAPLIEKSRVDGELRPGLDNERVVEWIRNIHAVITLRDDYSADEQRALFNQFLVPSILHDPPQ